MSGEAVGWAFRKVEMDDATAKFVLVAICNYANENDEAWPSHASIARLTGLSKRSIQIQIKKLEDWGLITRVRRDRDNGSETSAFVSLDIEKRWVVKGGIASPAIGVAKDVHGGMESRSTLETTTKPKLKKDSPYSEEFETLWLLYPRTRNTSKKKAWDYFRMLDSDRQEKVRAAVPVFAAAMRAEGRPEDKIKHFQFFLSERIYETVAAPASAISAPAGEWFRTATREQWQKCLKVWRGDMNWRLAWGPAPGRPGCCVPRDLLTEDEISLGSHNRVSERPALRAV